MTPEAEPIRRIRLQRMIEQGQMPPAVDDPLKRDAQVQIATQSSIPPRAAPEQPSVPPPVDATAGTAMNNRATQLEQQAQPAPGPRGFKENLVAGIRGGMEAFANPHNYAQIDLQRQQMEQQRQQQLLAKAQQLRGQAQEQNNFETQQQRLAENTASERAYQNATLEQTKRLRDIEQAKFDYDKTKPIEVSPNASLMSPTGGVLGTAPAAPTKPEAAPNTPFEVWRAQHPNEPVEKWVQLNRPEKSNEANTPFEVWRSQHPNDPIESWMTLQQQNSRPVSEGERTAYRFYERMSGAEKDISDVEDAVGKYGTLQQTGLNYLPNFLQSETNQRYIQAQRAFTEARLRKDSGAAIPQSEFENDRRMYFVQPGDGPQVIAQKKAARATALEAIRKSAGRAYEETYGVLPGKSPAPGAAPAAAAPGKATKTVKFSDLPK